MIKQMIEINTSWFLYDFLLLGKSSFVFLVGVFGGLDFDGNWLYGYTTLISI